MVKSWRDYSEGVALGAGTILFANILTGYSPFINHIPKVKDVQQGYIAPNKLEVKCKDLDGNGELETVIKISGEEYLLKMVEGKPTILPYKLQVETE